MQLPTDTMDKIIPHWALHVAFFYTGASFVATILIQFIPTTQEITWRPYVIFYNTIQRMSLHRRPWSNGSNGNGGPPNGGTH